MLGLAAWESFFPSRYGAALWGCVPLPIRLCVSFVKCWSAVFDFLLGICLCLILCRFLAACFLFCLSGGTTEIVFLSNASLGCSVQGFVQSFLNRELLLRADRQLVDSIAARRSLDREEGPRVERAMVIHHVELYTGIVSALQIRQRLLDREVVVVDQAFRSTADVGTHYLALEDSLGSRLGALELLLPF
ncbi:hypothetical protein LIER_09720 [Lithospermum erythrorhizon]|uniref:Uncharacterized protein n=1 Tax=Lithospermum erythrorhizon TaxID=34254 RepID=A0AAV3PGU5_LITER